MVKVNGPITKEGNAYKASLFADSKSEVTSDMKIVGLPDGYVLAPGSSCITADKDFAFLKSDGTWVW